MAHAEWLGNALAAPFTEHVTEVSGCPIHWLRWGDGSKPGLVLVHGGAAHAHWWRPLAPMLARQYDVVALDLSGHGDSGHRHSYPREAWAEEILSVANAAGFPGRPMVVGHSLGGLVVILAAALHGDRFAGAIIVDSPVRRPSPESQAGARSNVFQNVKVYPDVATIVGRFRLLPDQPDADPELVDFVARHSYRAVPGGFSWKFDPRIFQSTHLDEMSEYLRRVRCRVALIRGELSVVVPPETGEYMYELLERAAPLVEIPQGHHHLMFDQPLALVTALRALLADWEHSVPQKRHG
jgi:pimeloyl-ACP methyl ester carboxylesterase